MVAELREEMQDAAVKMEYEKAAYLRDEITKLEEGLGALPERRGEFSLRFVLLSKIKL